jgi:hypothetical protein
MVDLYLLQLEATLKRLLLPKKSAVGGIQISTQDQIRVKPLIVEVRFFKDGDNWEVDCDEAGLVGYANADLNVVRANALAQSNLR